MKNIRLIVGLTVVGLGLAVACGDDNNATNPGDGGTGGGGKAGAPSTGGKNSSSGTQNSDAGMTSAEGGMPGGNEGGGGPSGGGGPIGPGCGDGPACDEATQECVDGNCLLVDGEACEANADCIHTCIGLVCAPRADVLEDCDYDGAGGAGGAGGGAGGQHAGGAGGAAGGQGGEGGEGIFVPPEEIGNGDDADCLDGLACDSGACKRKQMTDCTGPEQCLSGLCHKTKCTLQEPGVCSAMDCAPPDPDTNGMCGLGTTLTNTCSFNYLPNSTCVGDIKGIACYPYCECQLAP